MRDNITEAAEILIGEEALRKLTKAHIVVRWERDTPPRDTDVGVEAKRNCETCRYCGDDGTAERWCRLLRPERCAPNGFSDWEAQDA